MESPTRVVADIGGSNTRLALFDVQSGQLSERRDYHNDALPSLAAAIDDWLQQLTQPQPEQACFAIAAPPFEDEVSMLNVNWTFSLSQLARQFGFQHICGLNDFEANAIALPHLPQQQLLKLHAGNPGSNAPLAIIGPGTGLGGATLRTVNGVHYPCASEPGHMSLAAGNAFEAQVLAQANAVQPVYAEWLLSGPGIPRLYRAIADVEGQTAEALSPEAISARALEGDCRLCESTLLTFCTLLGGLSGDYVLATGAYGGVFLAGGILPPLADLLTRSQFRQRFSDKAHLKDLLASVPLHLITGSETGLIGAAHAPIQAK